MRGLRALVVAGVVVLGGFAGGCCVKPGTGAEIVRPLPAPISLAEQLQFLNARARELANLRIGGTVVIRYHNEKGEEKQQTTDGKLDIRQRYGAAGLQDPGDLWLSGRVLLQEQFQAGKNQKKWWFFLVPDVNTAWVGDVKGGEDLSMAGGGGEMVMRADMVLPVLGITEIQPHAGETVAMLVKDEERSNNLLIVKSQGDGAGWVKREIIVDRDSGDVREVKLFDGSGEVMVRAELTKYRPINYREGEDVPPGFVAPRFPNDILITYVGQKASVHFVMTGAPDKRAELVNSLPEAVFETPAFEGMKVVRVGG